MFFQFATAASEEDVVQRLSSGEDPEEFVQSKIESHSVRLSFFFFQSVFMFVCPLYCFLYFIIIIRFLYFRGVTVKVTNELRDYCYC